MPTVPAEITGYEANAVELKLADIPTEVNSSPASLLELTNTNVAEATLLSLANETLTNIAAMIHESSYTLTSFMLTCTRTAGVAEQIRYTALIISGGQGRRILATLLSGSNTAKRYCTLVIRIWYRGWADTEMHLNASLLAETLPSLPNLTALWLDANPLDAIHLMARMKKHGITRECRHPAFNIADMSKSAPSSPWTVPKLGYLRLTGDPVMAGIAWNRRLVSLDMSHVLGHDEFANFLWGAENSNLGDALQTLSLKLGNAIEISIAFPLIGTTFPNLINLSLEQNYLIIKGWGAYSLSWRLQGRLLEGRVDFGSQTCGAPYSDPNWRSNASSHLCPRPLFRRTPNSRKYSVYDVRFESAGLKVGFADGISAPKRDGYGRLAGRYSATSSPLALEWLLLRKHAARGIMDSHELVGGDTDVGVVEGVEFDIAEGRDDAVADTLGATLLPTRLCRSGEAEKLLSLEDPYRHSVVGEQGRGEGGEEHGLVFHKVGNELAIARLCHIEQTSNEDDYWPADVGFIDLGIGAVRAMDPELAPCCTRSRWQVQRAQNTRSWGDVEGVGLVVDEGRDDAVAGTLHATVLPIRVCWSDDAEKLLSVGGPDRHNVVGKQGGGEGGGEHGLVFKLCNTKLDFLMSYFLDKTVTSSNQ
ncbi:hypothetical protein DFP72DRAFT_857661 [Ephemerocybe angulata]|uniref:Uncharacterized protein n=1 Tax=Ephemerocybe angulata TaxID=980116 RepID=A0A8H6HC59_9AGAR|nr:hypothetical protein DFP72DRAFT_857661 [Tulosesus angulatus]